jgi:hypothetical protein
MLNKLLSSQPNTGLLANLQLPVAQSHSGLQLVALLVFLKICLTCVLLFLTYLVIIVSLVLAFCAIVNKLSGNNGHSNSDDRTVI